MEGKTLKRARSEDEDNNNNITQMKVWVSQKISDMRDASKMKAVHEKTTQMLFSASAAGSKDKPQQSNVLLVPTGATVPRATAASLHEHYQLLGNGIIHLRDLHPDAANPNLERRKSRCCQRQTLIHDKCCNCSMDLCEECGYSCAECGQFVCRTCVMLFGSQPQEEADDPLCERCQMFCR
ncbi:uncharacterized protein [Drosophila tropicalis]|uniref:uncharacterized protein n=1 Tax=Drosophila tropicalis TaxID=46794 RepID=UPI0035ABA0F5